MYDGCTHRPCTICGSAAEKMYLICSQCRIESDLKKFNSLLKKQYDGSIIYSRIADKYLLDEDDIMDLQDELDIDDPNDLQMVFCNPEYARPIDPSEHYDFILPDDTYVDSELQANYE